MQIKKNQAGWAHGGFNKYFLEVFFSLCGLHLFTGGEGQPGGGGAGF